MTGWGHDEDRKRSREAGCDAHMVKPVQLPALFELISELSEAKAAADAS